MVKKKTEYWNTEISADISSQKEYYFASTKGRKRGAMGVRIYKKK